MGVGGGCGRVRIREESNGRSGSMAEGSGGGARGESSGCVRVTIRRV